MFLVNCHSCQRRIGEASSPVAGIICNWCLEARAFFRSMFSPMETKEREDFDKLGDFYMCLEVDAECERRQTVRKLRNIAELCEIEIEELTNE